MERLVSVSGITLSVSPLPIKQISQELIVRKNLPWFVLQGMGSGGNICMKGSLDLKVVEVGMDVLFSAGIKS